MFNRHECCNSSDISRGGSSARLIRLSYPKIEISGRDHNPRTEPTLLAANHVNSLIAPVIVGPTADRPVRFFDKAPLFKSPGLGRLTRARTHEAACAIQLRGVAPE